MADPERLLAKTTGPEKESGLTGGLQGAMPPAFSLNAAPVQMSRPQSLRRCVDTGQMDDAQLNEEIRLIRQWIQDNPGNDASMDMLIGELMKLEKVRDDRAGVTSNRERLSPREYRRAIDSGNKRQQIRDLESPTGHEGGAGGWLEASAENNAMFDAYFGSVLPTGITVEDLKILSSSITQHNPTFRELPPPDLWPNMRDALRLVRLIESESGITFRVLSGYRSDIVNALSGGAHGSAHLAYNGLDLEPQGDQRRAEAFLKHFWFTQGAAQNMGLGFYRRGRVHIDAHGHRRWPAAWRGETRATARTRYQRFFPEAE